LAQAATVFRDNNNFVGKLPTSKGCNFGTHKKLLCQKSEDSAHLSRITNPSSIYTLILHYFTFVSIKMNNIIRSTTWSTTARCMRMVQQKPMMILHPSRGLSSQTTQAVAKLQAILENYRLQKYVIEFVFLFFYLLMDLRFPSRQSVSNEKSSSIWYHHSYTQEIPTRFKKDIVHAAASVVVRPNHSTNNHNLGNAAAVVNATGLQHVLHNIGASNVLTPQELQAIFTEMGNEHGEIPAPTMVQLL
jgi:hypothetical protein